MCGSAAYGKFCRAFVRSVQYANLKTHIFWVVPPFWGYPASFLIVWFERSVLVKQAFLKHRDCRNGVSQGCWAHSAWWWSRVFHLRRKSCASRQSSAKFSVCRPPAHHVLPPPRFKKSAKLSNLVEWISNFFHTMH